MSSALPRGRDFELYTAAVYHELFPNFHLTHDDRVLGQSGLRQVDLSIRKNGLLDQIVEAKDCKRKVNIGLVDQLIGKASDVGVKAAMISASGYSARAIERAKHHQDITLLTILDPLSKNQWAFPFFAHSIVAVTLIDDLRLKFADDANFVDVAVHPELLCMETFDEDGTSTGRLHDIIFDLRNLPLEPCTLFLEGRVLIGNSNGLDRRKVMLTCQMQIRTEAWKGSLPMLTGKGLYDQNLSRATLTRDAKFELIPLQLLRRRWTRLKDMNAVSLISPFDFQLIGLAEKHFSTPHICSQVFGLPR